VEEKEWVSIARNCADKQLEQLRSLSRSQLCLQNPDTLVPGLVCVPFCVRQGNKRGQFQSLELPLEKLNEFGAGFFEVFHWLRPVDEAALFRWQ